MNPFDQFDGGNPFDAFDKAAQKPGKFLRDSQGRNVIPPVEQTSAVEDVLAGIKLPDWFNRAASTARSYAQGAADPTVGAVQLLANAVGQGDGINKAIAENEKKQSALKFNENGWDTAARFAGNVASPVNLLPAARFGQVLTAPASVGMRATQGAVLGATGAAIDPITDADKNGFWGQKAVNTFGGAVGGAVLTPALAKAGEFALSGLARLMQVNKGVTAQDIDSAIVRGLSEIGAARNEVSQQDLANLRQMVAESLKGGKEMDVAAALRKADFEALGIEPTLGQVTRDPLQFAKEMNLRGTAGVGEPLMDRFLRQGQTLQDNIMNRAQGAASQYEAGRMIGGALENVDDLLSKEVTARYQAARASAGKDLDVPLQGLAQDYAQTLSDFGDRIPAAIQAKFRELGLDPAMPANQKRVFTVEDADKLLKVINKNQSSEPATNTALAELRRAVKNAVTGAAPDGGVFAPAVKGAAERFALQDAVPALKAAAEGSIAPEDFVRRFVVGGKVDEVKGLAEILRRASPESFQQARAQIAETLRNAAYTPSMTGQNDVMNAASYSKAIQSIGREKLALFFSPEEVQQILREARVANYITRAPLRAPVNTSNTASTVLNIASGYMPGGSLVSGAMNLGRRAIDVATQNRAVNDAMRANVPVTPRAVDPTDGQRNFLAYLLSLSGLGVPAALE